MRKRKLSEAQFDLLERAVSRGAVSCIESYAPAKKLIEFGYVTARTSKFGQFWLEPTRAGRDALCVALNGAPETNA